jgi:outer membrane protein TolC
MRLPITLLLAFASVVSLRAEAPPIQGTLPEDFLPALKPILRTAVERSPTTIAASLSMAQAEAGRYLNAAALWPSLSANSSYQETKEKISQGLPSTSKGLLYGANIYQPLFEWGAYKNQAQIGNLSYKIAERQYADAYRTLATSIREQYMGLITKRIALRNARFQQQVAEKALAAQKARFEAGSVSEAEVQGFDLNVDDATLAADRAEEDYRYGKRVFTRLVGIEDLSDDLIPMELPHPVYTAGTADAVLAGFVGEGIESTFQSEVYRMSLAQADKSIKIARVRLLPKIGASASYAYSNYTAVAASSISQVGVTSESINIGANWTIFDGFATRGSRLSALASKRQTELNRQNYIDATVDSITYMRHQLDFAQRAMGLAEVHFALYDSQLKRFHQDKDLGYASDATIDAGTLNVNASQLGRDLARVTYLSNWTEFISLAGLDPALENLPSRYVR